MNGSSTNKPEGAKDDLHRLAAMPDDDVDTSDIPELLDWSQAERGKFYRVNARHRDPGTADRGRIRGQYTYLFQY